jgi:hypothetical protein
MPDAELARARRRSHSAREFIAARARADTAVARLPGDRTGAVEPASPPRPSRPTRSTATGISFDPLLPFEEWRALGARLGVYAKASSWWLGDWLAFGQTKYGRRYKEAIGATGLDYQTLRNYAVVARRFELSRRRDTLSFHHHAEVCGLRDDDQDRWLDLAAERGLSTRELRRRIRASTTPLGDASTLEVLRLAVDADRRQLWRDAARTCDLELQAWIVTVLDAAATSTFTNRDRDSADSLQCRATRRTLGLSTDA